MLYNSAEKPETNIVMIALKGVITSREFRVPGRSCDVGRFWFQFFTPELSHF